MGGVYIPYLEWLNNFSDLVFKSPFITVYYNELVLLGVVSE